MVTYDLSQLSQAPILTPDGLIRKRFDPKLHFFLAERYYRNRQADRRRWAKTQAIYNSEPPFDENELRAQGRGYESNFSTRTMEADVDNYIDEVRSLSINLFKEATLPLKPGTHKKLNEFTAAALKRKLEMIFSKVLRRWRRRIHEDTMVAMDKALFGPSLLMTSPDCWTDRRIPLQNILLDDEASSNESDWVEVGIIDYMTADELVKIATDKNSVHYGYNPVACAQILYDHNNLFAEKKPIEWSDVIDFLQMYRSSQNWVNLQKDTTRYYYPVVRWFIREYQTGDPESTYMDDDGNLIYARKNKGGKNQISEYIIPLKDEKHTGYSEACQCVIRRRLFAYESMQDIFTSMTYGPAAYFWGAKGLGVRTAAFSEIHSIIYSKMFDAAIDSLQKVFYSKDSDSINKLEELIITGSNTLVEGELGVVDTSFLSENLNIARNIANDMQRQRVMNNSLDAYRVEGAISPYETAKGAEIRDSYTKISKSMREAQFWADQDRRISRLFKNFRRWLNLYKKKDYFTISRTSEDLLEYASQLMEEEGVDVKDWDYVDETLVSAGDDSGRGSLTDRLFKHQTLSKHVPLLPPELQREWVKREFTIVLGPEEADIWLPENPRPSRTEQDQLWAAMVENGTLLDGFPVSVRSDDIDYIHINAHSLAKQTAQQRLLDGRMDAYQAAFAFSEILNHLFGNTGHVIRYIAMLPANSDFIKGEIERLGTLRNELVELIKESTTRAEQQQQEKQLDPIQQANLARITAQTQKILESTEMSRLNMAIKQRNMQINELMALKNLQKP